MNRQLYYGHGDLSIYGYVDSDYADCVDSLKSTTAWIYTFVGFVVPWRFVLQECTLISTIEVEYVTLRKACK